jgi:hypothetical protein
VVPPDFLPPGQAGAAYILAPWLEPQRAEIEAALQPLVLPSVKV